MSPGGRDHSAIVQAQINPIKIERHHNPNFIGKNYREYPAPPDEPRVLEYHLPVTHTSTIIGTVVDDNGDPITGATIKAVNPEDPTEFFETTSGVGGKYTLPVSFKDFPWKTLKDFDLDITRDGFTTKQKLINVIANRTAGSGKSVLKILDATISRIGTEGGTHINSLGDFKVVIPPGALDVAKDIRATLYNKSNQLPGPLPPTSFYTFAGRLTADEGDIEFNEPVTVRIANSLGFPSGMRIPIGYYNDRARQWEDSGNMATVSADENWVEFQTTHFSTPDVNLPALPPPEAQGPTGENEGLPKNETSTNVDTENQAVNCNASQIAIRTGNLFQDYTLPSIKSLNQDSTLTFVYNSTTAKPTLLLATQTDLDRNYTIQPETQSVKFEIEGAAAEAYFVNDWGKNSERWFWDARNGEGNIVSTGSYPYTITIANNYEGTYWTSDCFGCAPNEDTGISTREPVPETTLVHGRAMVNNQIDSPFGAGWNLAGIKRLYLDPDGQVLFVEGNGSSLVYDLPHEDLIVTNTGQYGGGRTVSTFLGRGDGNFQTQFTSRVGQNPGSVAVEDFDRDGHSDIVVTNSWDDNISILLGNGDGGFQPQKTLDTAEGPDEVGVGDFNNDRYQDIVVTECGDDSVYIFRGKGDGDFLSPTIEGAGNCPTSIAVGDFNNDRALDLAIANYLNAGVSILMGDGHGNFQNQGTFPVGDLPSSIATGDFNEDGFQDIVVTNQGDYFHFEADDISILLGKGNGDFWPQRTFAVGDRPLSVAVGDFDEDEHQDIVITNSRDDNISILLGNGDGNFQSQKILDVGEYPQSVAVSDFNKDDFADIAVVNYSTRAISIFLGKGDGNFQPQRTLRGEEGTRDIAVGHFNANSAAGEYEAPPGSYSKLRKNFDNTFTLTEKDGTVYHFDEDGFQTSEIDRNGNTVSYTYNEDNQLETISYPGNVTYTFVYDPTTKKLQSITDSAGRTSLFDIDAAGDLKTITNPDGTAINYTYDAGHLMKTKTTENGNTTDYIYDAHGRIQETLTPEYDVWDGSQIVRERVSTLYYPSDVKGLINDLPPGQGTPENPAPLVDPSILTDEVSGSCGCDVTKGHTNEFGSWTETEDGLFRKTIYSFDENNNLTNIRYPAPIYRSVSMTYDYRGNLLTLWEIFSNAKTTFTYEPQFNQVKTITDPLGNVTTFEYDPKGNLTQIIDDNDTVTEMTYDSRGLLETLTQAKDIPDIENTTNFSYYADTGNLQTVTDPLTHATEMTYDTAGNLKTILDAESKLTTYNYNLQNNRLESVQDPLFNLTQYTYDFVGNLKTVEDARDKVTIFNYNELNLLASIINPLGKTKQFAYDENRRMGRILDAKGQEITFEYDAAHQLKYKYLPEETILYDYDANGNLISIQDADSNLSFVYDKSNRLNTAQTLTGGLQPATTIDYTYDLNNNRATMRTPQNVTFKYFYDNLNRLTDIKDLAGTNIFSHYDYDELSRRTGLQYLNDTSVTYTYNISSQLIKIANLLPSLDPFSSFVYTYNNAGYRNTMITSEGTHIYGYDDLYRLETADHPNFADEAFTYDPTGNRLTKNASPEWSYDDANRLLDDGTYTYNYDDNGNLIEKILKNNPSRWVRYSYNSENQLIRMDSWDGSYSEYAYDGLGRRIQKDVNGTKTKYIYDNEDIIAEYSGDNVLQATYLHGPGIDEPIYMTRGGEDYYYHADGLGSITELTDESGTVVQSYKYDAFGKIVEQTPARRSFSEGGGSLANPFTYTAREFDSESGLYFYRARYMDPAIGRFLQEDPVGLAGGINKFTYVDGVGKLPYVQPLNETNKYLYTGNNPINRIDPLGLWYVDINISFIPVWFAGGNAGVMINEKGVWLYGGYSAGFPGPGASFTYSEQDPCPGWNSSVQGGFGYGMQKGADYYNGYFEERGIFTPGIGVSTFYVNQPWYWPWSGR